jgi:hypothetical protein
MLEWPRCSGLASGARPGRSVAMHMCGGGRGCEAPREGGPRAGRAPPLADGSSLDEVKRLGGARLPPLLRPQRAAGPQGIDRLPDRKLSSPGRPKTPSTPARPTAAFVARSCPRSPPAGSLGASGSPRPSTTSYRSPWEAERALEPQANVPQAQRSRARPRQRAEASAAERRMNQSRSSNAGSTEWPGSDHVHRGGWRRVHGRSGSTRGWL